MLPGLAALIAPHAPAELAAHMAGDEAFVVHGLRDSLAALRALPLLASREAVLAAWPDTVSVHLPDLADEASSIQVTPAIARKLFANGMGLLFDDAHAHVAELVPWLAALRAELGLAELTQPRCLIYATPAGTGTAPHFDQNVNFILQLHGTKTWWLAPNEHVVRPLTRHTMGTPADGELSTYATLPLPDSLPPERREIVLAPGSLLFVPRGMWHATRADSDSLQLNFTFTAPAWLDLLTAALRSKLALSAAWRETALPREPALFAALLRELAEDAATWTVEDLLAATEGVAAPDRAGED